MHGIRLVRFAVAGIALILASIVAGHGAPAPQAAIAAPQAGATAQNPGAGPFADPRTALQHLLSEHTVLAGITTQEAAMSAPNFEAAFRHLDQNSMLLSQFIGSVYGPEAAAQFLPLWRSHTQMYVDYTLASGLGDAAMRERARAAVNGWVQAQAAQFAALNPGLPAPAVAAQLQQHVDGTLAAIDTFAQGNYDQHYDIMHEAFEHSFMMADMMAMAIAQQFPDRYALQR